MTELQNWRRETRATIVNAILGSSFSGDWTVAGCGFLYLLGNGDPVGERTFRKSRLIIPFVNEQDCMRALVAQWLGTVTRNRERGMRRIGFVHPISDAFVEEISSGLSESTRRVRTYERVINRLVYRCINRRTLLVGDMRLTEKAAWDYLKSAEGATS